MCERHILSIRLYFEHEDLLSCCWNYAMSKAILEKRYAMVSSETGNLTEAGLTLHSDPNKAERLMMASAVSDAL